MYFTTEFLTALQQRLSVESRKGVHLNASPGRSRVKFDVQRLALIQPNLPKEFVQQLCADSTFEFTISIEKEKANKTSTQIALQEIARKLNLLHYEVEDILSEKGIHTFGFGYPLLIRRDSNKKIVVAPLLIWSLNISSPIGRNSWLIKRTEDDPLLINEVMLQHLRNDADLSLDELSSWLPENGGITMNQLEEMVDYLLREINVNNVDTLTEKGKLLEGNLQAIPEKKELEQESLRKARIHWGGLFSVFETQHQSIIRDYEELLLKPAMHLQMDDLSEQPSLSLSCMATDPSQQKILNSLSAKRNMVIHGPPGTGKSQTLTAIIINALAKGQKVLVVCGKQTALQAIANHLETKELQNLFALVKEVKRDRRHGINKARQAIDDRQFYVGPGTLFTNNDYKNQTARCESLIREINTCHAFLEQKIWGNYRWADLVSLLLKNNMEGGPPPQYEEVLLDGIPNVDEWERIVLLLQNGEALNKLANPFLVKGILSLERLIEGEAPDIREQLSNALGKYQAACDKVRQLNKAFEKTVQQYLSGKYERIYEQINSQLSLVKNYLEKRLATSIENQDVFIKHQENGLEYYRQLCDFMQNEEGLTFEPYHTENPTEIRKELKRIKSRINDWKSNWRFDIANNILEVGRGNLQGELEELPLYEQMQNNLKNLIDALNEEKWFVEKIMLQNTIEETLKGIEIKISEGYELLEGTGGFHKIYQWVQFFHQQNSADQQLLQKMQPERNWATTYSYHLFNQLLTDQKNPTSKIEEIIYDQLRTALEGLEEHQVSFIQSHWRETQRRAVIRFQQHNKLRVFNLYNKKSTAKFKKFSLRSIIETDLELFQSFFPVVLTTPQTASTLFAKYSGSESFDLVLFDEASQLKVEETIPALLKGKQKIIAGDEDQMPPSFYFSKRGDEVGNGDKVDDALLDFAMALPFHHQYLNFHYRSRHPALIAFSNAAFYGDRLCPMPVRYDEIPIDFIPVNGSYKEGLNEEEAKYVITLLQNLKRNIDGYYPSIGIATFNVKQRNLILGKIREEEINKPAFAAKLIELRARGLFVKNLKNIQGDERDVMIISTTYGKAYNGKFASRFGPINQSNGYKLLNVIITRAKYKIMVCTSVPAKVYQSYARYLKADGNTKKGVFYAWLAYAKAVSDGDEVKQIKVLNLLRKQVKRQSGQNSKCIVERNYFTEVAYHKLLPHVGEGTLEMNTILAGFKVDLLYRPADSEAPMIGIECMGSKDYDNSEAYCYDLHREEVLVGWGMKLLRTWAVDWWRDEVGEVKRIAQTFLSVDV